MRFNRTVRLPSHQVELAYAVGGPGPQFWKNVAEAFPDVNLEAAGFEHRVNPGNIGSVACSPCLILWTSPELPR